MKSIFPALNMLLANMPLCFGELSDTCEPVKSEKKRICAERALGMPYPDWGPSLKSVKTTFRVALTALLFSSGAGVAYSAEEKPQVEIMHWWSSDGESAALDVFIDRFEALGGHTFDSAKDSQSANREEAIERMSKGYPPTLTQWNAGFDVVEFYEFGLIDAITDTVLVEKLKRTLPAAVLDSVTHNGNIIAMPINIHSENWMWYSKDLIPHSGSLLAEDWDTLLALGKTLQQKNTPLLAVGDQSWQVRILFTSLLLGQSRDAYRNFYLNINDAVADDQVFKNTLVLFNQIAKFSRSFGDGNWNTQVKAVAEGKAGATFMGDWAKGEFQVLGQTPDKEFGCALTGRKDPGLLLVIDAFILGKVNDLNEKNGQALMLDVVSDPKVNFQFNVMKGSVSPYSKPPADQMDVCSAQVYEVLSNSEAVIPPYASYAHGAYMHDIDNTIYSFWKASVERTDDDALIEETLKIFKQILQQRREESEVPQPSK